MLTFFFLFPEIRRPRTQTNASTMTWMCCLIMQLTLTLMFIMKVCVCVFERENLLQECIFMFLKHLYATIILKCESVSGFISVCVCEN